MTNLFGVQRRQVADVWPKVAGLIDAAVKHGTSRVTVHDIHAGLINGDYQLWVVWADTEIKAVVVTETVNTAQGLMASIFICTGKDRHEWIDHLDTIEAWAKSKGCVLFSNRARYGWMKDLTKRGYRPKHVQMVKKL